MMRILTGVCLVISLLVGCAPTQRPERSPFLDSQARKPASPPTTQPILYHRTGGIAGTDDRLVIWPDGFVQVDGELFSPAVARLPAERHAGIRALFRGWDQLKGEYLSNNITDAYTITIHYGDKSVVANDIAPDLPQKFRDIFTELEAVAFEAQQQQNEVKPPPAAP